MAFLLLPLLASLLFVCGLLAIKRVSALGVSPWTVTFLANQTAAVLFSALWLLGGETPSISQFWQPALIACLYLLGQIFTFAAIEHGDVSVATPVFGVKVVIVACLLAGFFDQSFSAQEWLAVGFATLGIVMVQWHPHASRDREKWGRMVLTIMLALLAGFFFAAFDVVVQCVAPAWGPGRLIPITFWMVGVLSLGFLPFVQKQPLLDRRIRGHLLFGTLLIAVQALCIVYSIATFGEAARINVVYSLRGFWGVLLSWYVAVTWGGTEASHPRPVMLMRLFGAGLLSLSVVLVITS